MRIQKNTIEILKSGGVGVLPTDTIYGIVGSALNKKAVARIYKLRRRSPHKPMIILISDMRQETWDKFGIKPTPAMIKILKRFWPGKVSIILMTKDMRQAAWRKKWRYLHRGINSLAFRLPKPARLRRLLQKTGPLVAPSANWEGWPPAKTIKEAKKYFGTARVKDALRSRAVSKGTAATSGGIDFYVDGGPLLGAPSKLIKIERGKIIVLRK
jgi:L-threonylcarbamoyladenylate synthase